MKANVGRQLEREKRKIGARLAPLMGGNPETSSDKAQPHAWISQHENNPLTVHTERGLCQIWDSNYTVRCKWNLDPAVQSLVSGVHNKEDFELIITEAGLVELRSLGTT